MSKFKELGLAEKEMLAIQVGMLEQAVSIITLLVEETTIEGVIDWLLQQQLEKPSYSTEKEMEEVADTFDDYTDKKLKLRKNNEQKP